MTNSQSLALVVVSLGGTVTGKTNAGLLADIVRALGGTPTGNTNADLIGEIAAALGGSAGEGTNADRLKAVADALDIDASGTNAEVLAAILTGLGGEPGPRDTNAALILGISEHPPAQGLTVRFHVATASIGYGSVSPGSVTGVESGAAIDATAAALTVGGEAGCTATAASATSEYVYAFTGWTGADDASTPVPATVTEDIDLYAHFSRTALYDVAFYVATDSAGYGSVSPVTIQGVPAGTAVTVAQTLVVGSAGQCVATPEADTAEWLYSFGSWTGADDASTPAATVINADTAFYAHFSRASTWGQKMDPSLFTYTVENGEATVTGFQSGSEPAAGYVLYFPDDDGNGHPLTAIGPGDRTLSSGWTAWGGASAIRADSVTTLGEAAFYRCDSLTRAYLPSVTTLNGHAFYKCTSLASAHIPLATALGPNEFAYCALESASFPAAATIGATCLYSNAALASIYIPAATAIDSMCFKNCEAVTEVSFGPIATLGGDAFFSWTFYDADGTTVLDKTVAANLANSTFVGTASALVKQTAP